MSETRVHLFAEDNAHEQLLRPIVRRIAAEEACDIDIRVMSARGGHGKVLAELDLYQNARLVSQSLPDVLVIGVDANCRGHTEAKNEILSHVQPSFTAKVVIACPDPHIERWYLADAVAFQKVVGTPAPSVRQKCQRDFYKHLLAETVRNAGLVPTLGGLEFAGELVQQADWFRAGKTDTAFKHFLDDLRSKFRQSHK